MNESLAATPKSNSIAREEAPAAPEEPDGASRNAEVRAGLTSAQTIPEVAGIIDRDSALDLTKEEIHRLADPAIAPVEVSVEHLTDLNLAEEELPSGYRKLPAEPKLDTSAEDEEEAAQPSSRGKHAKTNDSKSDTDRNDGDLDLDGVEIGGAGDFDDDTLPTEGDVTFEVEFDGATEDDARLRYDEISEAQIDDEGEASQYDLMLEAIDRARALEERIAALDPEGNEPAPVEEIDLESLYTINLVGGAVLDVDVDADKDGTAAQGQGEGNGTDGALTEDPAEASPVVGSFEGVIGLDDDGEPILGTVFELGAVNDNGEPVVDDGQGTALGFQNGNGVGEDPEEDPDADNAGVVRDGTNGEPFVTAEDGDATVDPDSDNPAFAVAGLGSDSDSDPKLEEAADEVLLHIDEEPDSDDDDSTFTGGLGRAEDPEEDEVVVGNFSLVNVDSELFPEEIALKNRRIHILRELLLRMEEGFNFQPILLKRRKNLQSEYYLELLILDLMEELGLETDKFEELLQYLGVDAEDIQYINLLREDIKFRAVTPTCSNNSGKQIQAII